MPIKEENKKHTHYLLCRHCVGTHCREYEMPCNILGRTKSGKLKIEVFGERYWKNTQHIKKIRYVKPCRVMKAPELIGGEEC